MEKSRTKIPLKIEFETRKPMYDLEDLFNCIFWKETSLTNEAIEFLRHVKNWGRTNSPYRADDWEKYCTRTNMSQGKYHNMLRRLKKAGMIEKTYNKNIKAHEIKISDKFSQHLAKMERTWDKFCNI